MLLTRSSQYSAYQIAGMLNQTKALGKPPGGLDSGGN